MGSPITVLLVDDHAPLRAGYRRLLNVHNDIRVVGEAANSTEAWQCAHALVPDVIVMDVTLPGVGGIEVTRRILSEQPRACVLIVSMHEEPIFAVRALQAGACGFLTKTSAPETLVQAIHTVARGERYLSSDVASVLAL